MPILFRWLQPPTEWNPCQLLTGGDFLLYDLKSPGQAPSIWPIGHRSTGNPYGIGNYAFSGVPMDRIDHLTDERPESIVD